jgi:hypothetical protein
VVAAVHRILTEMGLEADTRDTLAVKQNT